jgi:STE24 endopeptidase
MLTVIFVLALLGSVAIKLWLGLRQVRHVVRHRTAVPERFAQSISLAAHQNAADYTVAKTHLSSAYTLVEATLLVCFTLLGGLQMLDQGLADLLVRSSASSLVRGMLLIGAVILITALVDLPFSIYRQFSLEERFGFNRMTPTLFIQDTVKSALIGVVLGAPLLYAVLWFMQAAGHWWWLATWMVFVGFSLFVGWLVPVVIAPLFNRFTPLEDASLIERVRALAARCGFTAKGVFVMDGSKRSGHGNAYFTGLGSNKRIVFFDTLIARLSPSELEAVLAHELGHFRLRHVVKRLVFYFACSFVALAALGYLSEQPWFYLQLGVDPSLATQNAMALVLFLLVLPVFTFLLSPLLSRSSRTQEFEADAYAAGQTDANELMHALVKLYQDNAATLTPDPLHSAFFDSHPPASIRIARLEGAST